MEPADARRAIVSRSRRAAWVLASAAGFLPAVAEAAPQNLFGGRVVEDRQAWVSLGYPDLEAGVRFPVRPNLDVGPAFRFGYGVATYAAVPNTIAFQPGVTLRWMVLDTGTLTGAVVGDIWVGAAIGTAAPAFGVGLVDPGFVLTSRFARRIDLSFGIRVQLGLWVQEGDVFLLGAVPLIVAFEFPVAPDVGLGFRFEGGPAFGAGGSAIVGPVGSLVGGGIGARVRAVVGVSFRF